MEALQEWSAPGCENAARKPRIGLADALAPHRLSVAQYGALSVFDVLAELSSAELARISAVTPQSMNTIVHELVDQGLLDRQRHPTHGKIVVLRLSRRGRRRLDHATAAVRPVEDRLLQSLSPAKAQTVRAWLADVPSQLDDCPLPVAAPPLPRAAKIGDATDRHTKNATKGANP